MTDNFTSSVAYIVCPWWVRLPPLCVFYAQPDMFASGSLDLYSDKPGEAFDAPGGPGVPFAPMAVTAGAPQIVGPFITGHRIAINLQTGGTAYSYGPFTMPQANYVSWQNARSGPTSARPSVPPTMPNVPDPTFTWVMTYLDTTINAPIWRASDNPQWFNLVTGVPA